MQNLVKVGKYTNTKNIVKSFIEELKILVPKGQLSLEYKEVLISVLISTARWRHMKNCPDYTGIC